MYLDKKKQKKTYQFLNDQFLNKTYFFCRAAIFRGIWTHVIGGSPGHLLPESYVPTLLSKEQKKETINISGVCKD